MAATVANKNRETHSTISHYPRFRTPPVDIYEDDDGFLLQADMPGVKKEDLSVTVENGTLSLTGRRAFDSCGTICFEEFGPLGYRRSFSLPQSIDTAKVTAKLQAGVLHLSLPKSETVKSRVIEISHG